MSDDTLTSAFILAAELSELDEYRAAADDVHRSPRPKRNSPGGRCSGRLRVHYWPSAGRSVPDRQKTAAADGRQVQRQARHLPGDLPHRRQGPCRTSRTLLAVRGCSQHCYLGRVAQKDNVEARAGRELQHPFLPPVVCAILAVGAAAGAFSASGILRVILIVLAVLLFAYTAMLYVAGLLHSIMSRVHDRPARPGRGTGS